MTNEQAIKILSKVTFYWELGEQTLTQNQINEAIDMTIKALGQQPCNDCISRDAVLALSEWYGEQTTYLNPMPTGESAVPVDAIKALPCVQPQPTWIPIDERLPEKHDYYLTTVKIEIHDLKPYYEIRAAQFDGRDFDIGYIGDGFRVVAWMPLPQVYTESEGEEVYE